MRIIALIFLLSLGYYGYSQGNKFMSRLYGNQYYYEFHEDNTLSKYFLTSSASNIESIFYNSAICDYNGTPLYLDLGHSIYGFKSGEKVKASDSLVGGTTSNLILRVGDTTFHSIHCWNLDNSLEPKIKASYKAYSKPFDDVLTFGGGIYVNELNADGIIK
jgi:hypothetical protein